ncbi:hypothetical protein GO988_02475 [Hymenobacter sp. HMF4947]|uniref:Uncharacterized protein n=1 Tax=Hymenobacter ginkgonis TaxID=2682976 RepID=A0A7K1TAH1_9BACT|nr:hypothetical protein [Hymenobacter ginkgonis]MVN75181.1 hypothetical protein [Hymenobacter ginkgonis]
MDQHEKIERRTFSGPGTNNALDGYAGFRVGQSYQLRWTVLENSDVSIAMDHVERTDLAPAVMTAARFKEWFAK